MTSIFIEFLNWLIEKKLSFIYRKCHLMQISTPTSSSVSSWIVNCLLTVYVNLCSHGAWRCVSVFTKVHYSAQCWIIPYISHLQSYFSKARFNIIHSCFSCVFSSDYFPKLSVKMCLLICVLASVCTQHVACSMPSMSPPFHPWVNGWPPHFCIVFRT